MKQKNGHKIRRLIEEFNTAYNEAEYNAFMASNTKSKIKREEFLEEQDHYDNECFNIALKIESLKPSKYMLKKYVDLVDILEYL